MRLVFATLENYSVMAQALTLSGATNRLLSYYIIKDRPPHALQYYVETGLSIKVIKHRPRSFRENRQAYTRERRIALAKRLKDYEDAA